MWFKEDEEKFEHASTGSLRGMKSDMWEGGSRVPFIVSGPSIFAKEAQSSQMICFSDMMATWAELVEEKTINLADFHSYSFLPILQDPNYIKPIRKELIIEKKVYRHGDWKFIDGSGQGGIELKYSPNKDKINIGDIPGELYNLKEDISEQNNLFDEHPEKVSEMKKRLHEILSE